MKKAISMLLVLALCLSLCACGQSTSSKSNANVAQNAVNDFTPTQTENVNVNDSLVEFENVVLVDNDTIKIELVNFYAEDVNWFSDVQNEKYITVKATNKSNHDITLNPGNFYLGDEAVVAIITTGSIAPAPGKSGSYTFMIKYNTSPEATSLNSLEELYTLEGSFSGLNIYDDSSKNTKLSVDFNIQSAINGETAIAPTEPEYLSIGNTASTDFANFTLTSLEYVDRLNATTGSGILSRDRGLTDAGLVVGNKIFAVIHFDFTNLAKTEKRVTDVVAVTVDYNNGYLYRTSDGLSYMFDSTGFYNNYSGEGYILDLSPLESDNFKVCVPVAEVVGADTTSPLQIKIELQGDNETQTFVYVIR